MELKCQKINKCNNMPNNRKAVGVTEPHPRPSNKSILEPRNVYRSGQVSQHTNDKIHEKEKYTKMREGGVHQIGGGYQTKQGGS